MESNVARTTPDGVLASPLGGGLVSFAANARNGDNARTLLERLLREVRERGLSAVQGNIFADPGSVREAISKLDFPVSVLAHHDSPTGSLLSARVTALPAGKFSRVTSTKGEPLGARWETAAARYLLLGGLASSAPTKTPGEQSAQVWRLLKDLLTQQGFALTDIVRTWFFNDHILDWYDDFNRVRTAFFNEHDIFGKLVPASTGVGASNAIGTALSLDALAASPKRGLTTLTVPSPLQCPANDYKSAFSRAVEIDGDGGQHLLVSGTASIEPGGLTAHPGDLDAQIKLSLRVVDAILQSRGLGWRDVSRSVLYFPKMKWMERFAPCRDALGIPPFPAIFAHCDICRDDLLFELELDLWKNS